MEETSLVEAALPLLVGHGVYLCGLHLTHFVTRLIFGTFFSSIGFAALLAPKLAMYTALACRVHRPKYDLPRSTYTSSSDYIQNGLDSQQKCASDPVVQAVVARLNAGLYQIPYLSFV